MEFIKKNQNRIKNIVCGAAGVITLVYTIMFFFNRCFGASMTRNYNLYFALILCAIAVAIGSVFYLLLSKKQYSYAKLYLILGLCWGIAMQLTMPPCSGPDEEEHIINAFHASNTYLGLKDQEFNVNWETGKSYFYMRAEDMQALEENEFSFPNAYYIISNGNIVHCSDSTLVKNYQYPARFYRYIFSGFGIAVGRMLGLGFVGVLMLGRLVNTVIYVLMGYLILRVLPVGKLQMMSYLLLPTVLELCNCYSYDNFSILFSMLLLALCLYYSRPEVNIRLIDMFVLVVCVALLAPNKYVYVTFVIWVLMIPFIKWKNWITKKRKPIEIAGLIALIGSVVFVAIFVIWKIVFHMIGELVFKKAEGSSIEQMAGRESFTIGYMLKHPLNTLIFCLEGIANDFWYNLKCVVGYRFGDAHLNAPIPVIITILFMVVIAIGLITSKGKRAGKKQIIVTIIGAIICLIAIFIGCLVRFTPVEGTDHVQVAYRYLVPFYMCLVVIFGTEEKESDKGLMVLFGQNILLALTTVSLLNHLLG